MEMEVFPNTLFISLGPPSHLQATQLKPHGASRHFAEMKRRNMSVPLFQDHRPVITSGLAQLAGLKITSIEVFPCGNVKSYA